jgi:hypothetical protein
LAICRSKLQQLELFAWQSQLTAIDLATQSNRHCLLGKLELQGYGN